MHFRVFSERELKIFKIIKYGKSLRIITAEGYFTNVALYFNVQNPLRDSQYGRWRGRT